MTPDDKDADELITRSTQGDPVALEALLERMLPGLRAFVRLQTGREIRAKESCSDLVQSVCREVIQNADCLKYGGEAGFKRWLYRTALRKIADRGTYYRRDRRDVRREASPPSPSADDAILACYGTFCTPSRHADAREQLERVEAAFDRLPAEQRDLIVSARLLGMSRAEIGEQMGKSEGAVRTMLHRALSQLAEELDDVD